MQDVGFLYVTSNTCVRAIVTISVMAVNKFCNAEFSKACWPCAVLSHVCMEIEKCMLLKMCLRALLLC